uniref:Beta/gamma crystallin 'Greek key' domain-containing protein n=1 Tax=Caenorhabditis tropicalis TaxID=1561998 RepID=A0A1I7UJI1_9PELO
MIRYPLLLISLSFTPFALAGLRDYVSVAVGENAILELPQVANYRRIPSEGPQVGQEHIYRVCNGKNKKTCGFWENVKVILGFLDSA